MTFTDEESFTVVFTNIVCEPTTCIPPHPVFFQRSILYYPVYALLCRLADDVLDSLSCVLSCYE